MSLWGYTVHDREGGIIASSEEDEDELFDSAGEAHRAGCFYEDDPRYGSHEVWEAEEGAHGTA